MEMKIIKLASILIFFSSFNTFATQLIDGGMYPEMTESCSTTINFLIENDWNENAMYEDEYEERYRDIERGVLEKRIYEKKPVLFLALEEGCPEVAKLLINAGADVNAKYEYSYYSYRHDDDLKKITEYTEKPVLFLALEKDYPEIAKLLISKGMDVDAKYKYEYEFIGSDHPTETKYEKKPVLFLALEKDYPEIVNLLIENNVNMRAMYKAENVEKSVLDLVLEKYVDENVGNSVLDLVLEKYIDKNIEKTILDLVIEYYRDKNIIEQKVLDSVLKEYKDENIEQKILDLVVEQSKDVDVGNRILDLAVEQYKDDVEQM